MNDGIDSTDPRRAAAAWQALQDGDEVAAEDRAVFADWLRQSPAHVKEYLQLGALRERLRDPDIFAGLAIEGLQARISANVETLAHAPPAQPRRAHLWRLGLAAGVVLALAAGWIGWWIHVPARYSTQTGEQRSIVLPDGSIAELNTRSDLKVEFSATGRDLTLNEGEALFQVAHDHKRPFRVHSGATTIQALGTQFTVRRYANGQTAVTVLEGRVRVDRIELNPGQRLANGTVRAVDPSAALAWQTRRLVFDDLPLERVIEEFNRYNQRQLRLQGRRFGPRSITGVFNANDPDSFLVFLEGTGGVTVERGGEGDILLTPKLSGGQLQGSSPL